MNEERIEILRMVADGVINVDEAERLIEALGGAERKRAEPKRAGAVAGAFEGVSDLIGTIGQVVQSTVDDAMEAVDIGMNLFDGDDGEPEGATTIDAPDFDIPEGGELVIRRSHAGRMSGFGLTLLAGQGARCTIEPADDGADIRTVRRGNQTRIHWRQGPLTVRVPPTVSRVDAKVLGGDLVVRDLPCALHAQVVAGRMELRGLSRTFDCKAVGGDVDLGVDAGLRGTSRAKSVGGNLVLSVAEGLDARVVARSTGGEVRADPGVGKVRRDGHRIHRRTVIGLGLDSDDGAEISLDTVGGDVVVHREQR